MSKEGIMEEKKGGLSRRSFLTGTGIIAAGIAGTSLVGCGGSKSRDTASASASASGSAAASGASSAEDSAIWAIKELGSPKETVKADVCICGAGGTGRPPPSRQSTWDSSRS